VQPLKLVVWAADGKATAEVFDGGMPRRSPWADDVDDFSLTKVRRRKKKRGGVTGVAVPSPRASGASDRAGAIGADAARLSELASSTTSDLHSAEAAVERLRAKLAQDEIDLLATEVAESEALAVVRKLTNEWQEQAAKAACSAWATGQRTGAARRKCTEAKLAR
jgi:hypothetical protein